MRALGGLFDAVFCSTGPASASYADLPEDDQRLPPFFAEILVELLRYKSHLGGVRNFEYLPRIERKVTKDQFRSFTDFEYAYLTVVGLANLHVRLEEVVSKCNGRPHVDNPGVQLLEFLSGMTMHGDREGVAATLRSAPQSLLEGFRIAKASKRGTFGFFKEAFDRSADPCLEGRVGRLLAYIEKEGAAAAGLQGVPPWEDVSVQPLPDGAPAEHIVAEHLRVFTNECTWGWAKRRKLDYEAAKTARSEPSYAAEFDGICNAGTFRDALRARGVVVSEPVRWECQVDEAGRRFEPYEMQVTETIERARRQGRPQVEIKTGPKKWTYVIDLTRSTQVNPKTRKERPIRMVKSASSSSPAKGQISEQQLEAAIAYFVDLCTLAPEPSARGG